MAVEVKIKGNLTEADWGLYLTIWATAKEPNPFISPRVLQLVNQELLHISFIYEGDKIIGAIPFLLRNDVFSLAGEVKSDSLNFLFLLQVGQQKKYDAINKTFKSINFKELAISKLIENSSDYLLVTKVLKKLGYKYKAIPSSKNPFVKFDAEEYTEEKFLKVFSKRNTRNYCNKLNREFGYKVTAIEKFEEQTVKKWLETFFTFHIARWNATSTPSIYSDKRTRTQLFEKVKAWLNDNIGVLFSIDVNDEPMAMAICLKKEDTIIYHQICSSGEQMFSKYPKQKILILELAKWMLENTYKAIDFGVGVEPYKYEYANKDPHIIRLYAAKSIFSKLYIRGVLDYYYQRNPKVQELLNGKIRPAITKVKSKINLLKTKLRVNLKESNGNWLVLFQKIGRKSKPNIEHFYRFDNAISFNLERGYTIAEVGMLDMLDFYEKEIILTPQKKLHYINALVEKKKTPWGLYDNEENLVSIAWLAEPTKNDDPPVEGIQNLKVIIDCFTGKNHRGKGYYPILINRLAKEQNDDTVMIYTNDWNIASQKGIQKAGFKEIITRRTTKATHEWILAK